MDMGAAVAAIRDCDAVVHLAAIPNPFNDPAERVMTVNMVTTYNVLEAVRLNDVPRIVYGCSESSSGFGVHRVDLRPRYLPIDEEHPCWPHEVYSFTKRFGEEMVREYSHAFGIAGISLRYCWVLVDRDAEAIRGILRSQAEGKRDPKAWFGSYIAPHDVAQACRLACRFEFPGRDGGAVRGVLPHRAGDLPGRADPRKPRALLRSAPRGARPGLLRARAVRLPVRHP